MILGGGKSDGTATGKRRSCNTGSIVNNWPIRIDRIDVIKGKRSHGIWPQCWRRRRSSGRSNKCYLRKARRRAAAQKQNYSASETNEKCGCVVGDFHRESIIQSKYDATIEALNDNASRGRGEQMTSPLTGLICRQVKVVPVKN